MTEQVTPIPEGTTATTAPAPVAAPVAAPAPTPAPAAPAPVPEVPEPFVDPYEDTGNPALDVAFEFLHRAGVGSKDPAVAAARMGDFAPIEAKLKSLGDKAKGFEKTLALAKSAYETERAGNEAKATKALGEVERAVGGKDRWVAIRTWASAEATEEQRTQINAALTAGGIAASGAAEKLARMYDKANPRAKLAESGVKPTAGASTSEGKPMTSKEYSVAVQDLARKARGREINDLPEYKALQASRRAARAAGVQ